MIYPSRKEVIDALKDDCKIEGFEDIIAIIEMNRKSENIALLKGELIQNGEVILRGKIASTPSALPEENWNEIEIGESLYYGISLEYRGETLIDMFKEGVNKCIKEGRLPFIHV